MRVIFIARGIADLLQQWRHRRTGARRSYIGVVDGSRPITGLPAR
jgi:hypothetical protein